MFLRLAPPALPRLLHSRDGSSVHDLRKRVPAELTDSCPATVWARLLELSVGWDEPKRLWEAVPSSRRSLPGTRWTSLKAPRPRSPATRRAA